jgi:Transposase and inactivated derivatives
METVTITKAEYENLVSNLVTEKDERARLERQVEYLLEQMRLARHRQFGASSEKSEYDHAQLNLFNEAEVMTAPEQPELELVEVEKHYRKRTRLTTDKLPDDLPVETIEYELPEAERSCVECGGKLHVMNYDTRRELVIIPAQVNIREHRRAIYSCRCCEQTNDHVPIRKADMPSPVIPGSFASPAAVAHIMTQKFVMGVPLYRQEQEWQRQGIRMSRQTMSNWLLKTAESWLEPLYERLKAKLLEYDVLHADETTLQVLREPGKTAQSKSYMWLYRTSGDAERPIVLYDYQNSRKAEHPKRFLESWKGYLHADGYEGYHRLPECITVVGCWAHLRRKFDEALKSLPESAREGSLALNGKRFCDRLFALERDFADLSPEHRYEKRMESSKPLMAELFAWADSCGALPKTPVGKAVHYAFTQRKYLERYLLDGRLEISNNRAERSIKPFVIGRKNWLFANTPRGARASAVIYSIIETAKENELNPYDYLTYIFERAPNVNIQNPAFLETLMPCYFKTAARI